MVYPRCRTINYNTWCSYSIHVRQMKQQQQQQQQRWQRLQHSVRYVSFGFELCAVRLGALGRWTPMLRCSLSMLPFYEFHLHKFATDSAPRISSRWFASLCRLSAGAGYDAPLIRITIRLLLVSAENTQLNWKITWRVECASNAAHTVSPITHTHYRLHVIQYTANACPCMPSVFYILYALQRNL